MLPNLETRPSNIPPASGLPDALGWCWDRLRFSGEHRLVSRFRRLDVATAGKSCFLGTNGSTPWFGGIDVNIGNPQTFNGSRLSANLDCNSIELRRPGAGLRGSLKGPAIHIHAHVLHPRQASRHADRFLSKPSCAGSVCESPKWWRRIKTRFSRIQQVGCNPASALASTPYIQCTHLPPSAPRISALSSKCSFQMPDELPWPPRRDLGLPCHVMRSVAP